ncbi:MAG: carbonic anhydrase [Simkaniaceae bacterium]|nr:carbonic anhydrase [Simkaniaceae bacterium]
MRYLITLFLFCCTSLLSANGIDRLMQGNNRYIQDTLEHPNRTPERREAVALKQEPFAVIVGCSDSRVSPEIIFDQGVGDLFVVRVAGNVIGPLELDSIEYAALYLHSSTLLILGHETCGAVKAVVDGTTKNIESIASLIEPSVQEEREKKVPNLLEASIKANAMNMRNVLLKNPAIAKLVEDKKLEVYAGYYHLQTGKVELL